MGIIGGTGSSKSTLVQLIPRLYDATEGAVLVGGRDVREYDIEALREEVAMYYRKTCCFRERLKKICAGATRKQRTRNWCASASWPRRMSLSSPSRTI